MKKIKRSIISVLILSMLMSFIPEGFGMILPVFAEENTVETPCHSNYTVEFSYNALQYVLNGDESVALSEILSKINIFGEVTDVIVSDPDLFSASKENGKWIITANKAFSTNEWMKVTIGDITYEITVTDTPTASGTCGDNVTWVLEDGTLTISGSGDMNDLQGTHSLHSR